MYVSKVIDLLDNVVT